LVVTSFNHIGLFIWDVHGRAKVVNCLGVFRAPLPCVGSSLFISLVGLKKGGRYGQNHLCSIILVSSNRTSSISACFLKLCNWIHIRLKKELVFKGSNLAIDRSLSTVKRN
jgi:hypothetical protein